MFSRKECKKNAKMSFRRHYILFVFLCLVSAVIGTAYTSSYDSITDGVNMVMGIDIESESAEGNHSQYRINDALTNILKDHANSKEIISNLVNEEEKQPSTYIMGKHIEIGHFDGVLAGVVNQMVSGAFIISLASSVYSVLGSSVATVAFLVILSFAVIFIIWMFFVNVFKVVYARMFLEGRLYKTVPMQRIAYLIYVRKWAKASLTMLLKAVYLTLWQLTIIGGIIKSFSYFAVPYIVAENPDISPRNAIKLSRRMMNGHKWECFKLWFSFIGWEILNMFTFGITGILFSNPYKEASYCEYFAYIRECAKHNQLEGSEQLEDTYLYMLPSDGVLERTYGRASVYSVTASFRNDGFFRKICDFFGVYFKKEDGEQYAEYLKQKTRYNSVKNVLAKEEYGTRFLMTPEKKRFQLAEYLFYNRRYSVWSLIMLFAAFSFIGWVWEVTLHLVQHGDFVNRGVLHGPWLPIYGTGGILILLVLNKLRNKPIAEFFSAIVLCGFVEYFVGLNLELTHGGQKWWDYRGFFFNIDGRVCAEGLLVFGLGGMVIVYFIAPLFDNLIQKIPQKIVIIISVVFLSVFIFDNTYSSKYPNTGEGISSQHQEYLIRKEMLNI